MLCVACSPTLATRGNLLDPEKLAEVKPGTTTREDVVNKLGSPTNRSAFDDKTWYYIGRRTRQYSFLDPKVTDQEVVTIHFDDNGVVKSMEKAGKDQIADISAAPGKTPSYGHETTWLQDLFGNIGRAGAPISRQR